MQFKRFKQQQKWINALMMIFNHSDHVHSHIDFLHENSNETFLWIFNHSGMSTQAVIFAFGKKIQMTFFEDFQLL